MSLLLGPAPKGGFSDGIGAKGVTETRSPVKVKGPTGKLMKAFFEAFDSLSFSTGEFALMLDRFPDRMQARFLEMVVAYFALQSDKVDRHMFEFATPEEYDRMMNGKRVYQALRPFHFPSE